MVEEVLEIPCLCPACGYLLGHIRPTATGLRLFAGFQSYRSVQAHCPVCNYGYSWSPPKQSWEELAATHRRLAVVDS